MLGYLEKSSEELYNSVIVKFITEKIAEHPDWHVMDITSVKFPSELVIMNSLRMFNSFIIWWLTSDPLMDVEPFANIILEMIYNLPFKT